MAKFKVGDVIIETAQVSSIRGVVLEKNNSDYNINWNDLGPVLTLIETIDQYYMLDPAYILKKEFNKDLKDLINET